MAAVPPAASLHRRPYRPLLGRQCRRGETGEPASAEKGRAQEANGGPPRVGLVEGKRDRIDGNKALEFHDWLLRDRLH
jgi:hypothetical protein